METLSVTLSPEMKERLETLATAIGKPVEECLVIAVEEFCETWETHLSDIDQIDEAEARAVLKAANE